MPAEEVPPEAPEPALGVNFARDGMVGLIQLAKTVQVRPMGMDASTARLRAGKAGLAEPGGGAQRLLAAGPGVLQRGSPEQGGPVRAGPHPQPRHLPTACCCPGPLTPVCTRREALFCLINAEPTCYEVVSGKVVRDGKAKKRGAPGQPAMRQPVPNPPLKAQRPVRGGPPNPSWAASKHGCRLEAARAPGRRLCCCPALCIWTVRPCCGLEPDRAHVDGDGIRLQAVRPPGPQRRPRPDDDEDDDEEEEEENGVGPMDDQYADGEGDPCPNCGRVYRRAPRAGCRQLSRALCRLGALAAA